MKPNDKHEMKNNILEGTRTIGGKENFLLKKPVYMFGDKRKYTTSGEQGQNAIFLIQGIKKSQKKKIERNTHTHSHTHIFRLFRIYIYI